MNFSAMRPVAIGGLGGSGTRVVAAMVRAAGVDIGSCLNRYLDNLWFTVLFKRSRWVESLPEPAEVVTAAELFGRAMTVGLSDTASADERDVILSLGRDLPPDGLWVCGARSHHAAELLDSTGRTGSTETGWGWKEPNTHVFLSDIDRVFPKMRYIHVVRDALDMAFSSNVWQMEHWGPHFGVSSASGPTSERQLRYWVEANSRALDYGQSQMADRFLAISYEALCSAPGEHWRTILEFLGVDDSSGLPEDLVAPTSIGRSVQHDQSVFVASDLTAARDVAARVATFNPVNR